MNLKLCETENIIFEIKNVSKRFNEKCILHEADFLFEYNENYLITGPSGVGKTTLLNIIAGLDFVDSGKIVYKKGLVIQYLFQEVLLFSELTVRENLIIKWGSNAEFSSEFKKEDFEKYLEDVGLGGDIIDKKVDVLSGGEKRRVQLAQILRFNPDLLLLDEPTANLDYENKEIIIDLVNKTFPKTTKIIVSHDVEYIPSEYQRIILRNGGISSE